MAKKNNKLKAATDWAKAEAKGRYEQRRRQMDVDLMCGRISRSEHEQMKRQARAGYESDIKDIERMFS